ncbi:hypothetical protein CP8484711_2209A, partial [Chlamydia psittaci 84-8471/1]
MRCI